MKKITACLILLSLGCHSKPDYPQMLEDANTETIACQDQVKEIQGKINNLSVSVDNLNNEFQRLQVENWRDVIPDMMTVYQQVEVDLAELKSSAGVSSRYRDNRSRYDSRIRYKSPYR